MTSGPLVAPILAENGPTKTTGRHRVDVRATMDAIIFLLRSGRRWTYLGLIKLACAQPWYGRQVRLAILR